MCLLCFKDQRIESRGYGIIRQHLGCAPSFFSPRDLMKMLSGQCEKALWTCWDREIELIVKEGGIHKVGLRSGRVNIGSRMARSFALLIG
jgi:hypothetical protein